jgi:glycosyltransferase involved in cell wall biosynthesis
VRSELRSLGEAGFEVALFDARTDELSNSSAYRLRAGLRVATGRGRDPLDGLRGFEPDVVHIHNLFPNFGRQWVRGLDVPVVHTLHNYRPLCANGLLFRDGTICTLCPDGHRWAGVRYACYRGSRLATLPLAVANREGPRSDPLLLRADRIIALSEAQRDVYVAAGAPSHQMVVWPNFLLDDLDPGGPSGTSATSAEWLYVGRLDEEKGILPLLRRWPGGVPLRVVGDGPLRDAVSAAAGPRVEVLGSLDRPTVLELMSASIGLVFPSLWYEAAPLVYVEALAAGLPVLATHPNAVARSVCTDGTGTVMRWEDDDLQEVLEAAGSRFPELRGHCRAVFEARHTQDSHADRARQTYTEATAVHRERARR